jgi:hypothetical protein
MRSTRRDDRSLSRTSTQRSPQPTMVTSIFVECAEIVVRMAQVCLDGPTSSGCSYPTGLPANHGGSRSGQPSAAPGRWSKPQPGYVRHADRHPRSRSSRLPVYRRLSTSRSRAGLLEFLNVSLSADKQPLRFGAAHCVPNGRCPSLPRPDWPRNQAKQRQRPEFPNRRGERFFRRKVLRP